MVKDYYYFFLSLKNTTQDSKFLPYLSTTTDSGIWRVKRFPLYDKNWLYFDFWKE